VPAGHDRIDHKEKIEGDRRFSKTAAKAAAYRSLAIRFLRHGDMNIELDISFPVTQGHLTTRVPWGHVELPLIRNSIYPAADTFSMRLKSPVDSR